MAKGNFKETVLVLDAATKASIPIIESCASLGLRVIAASDKQHCCGFYCRGTRAKVVYPSLRSKPRECLYWLVEFLKSNNILMIFPLGHFMTDFIAGHQDTICKYTRLILPDYATFSKGLSKIPTLKAAIRCGCPVPRSWFPKDQALEEITHQATYPALIKPTISVGARGMMFCNSANELLSKFSEVEANYGESFVQELIPQTGIQYKTAFILGFSQELLAGIVYSKLRFYPPTGGSSTLNQSVHRPDILQYGLKVARELKWVGPCDCDFITDPRDNVPKLMEINPRFSDTYKMTSVVGMDWTKIVYQMAKGENPTPQLDYPAGKYLRFIFGDIMWFLNTKDNRWKAKPSFFDFFRQDTTYLMTGTTDLGPMLGYLLENLSILWDKEARQFRFRRHHG